MTKLVLIYIAQKLLFNYQLRSLRKWEAAMVALHIFLDLSKANRDVLLNKMENYGTRGHHYTKSNLHKKNN